MAIAVGSTSNTPTYGTRTNSTITAPSGIANGDLLVAVLHVGDASLLPALTVTPPTGFTEVTNSPSAMDRSADTYTISERIYYKVASGESGNYTFTHSSADTEGFMYRLTGCDTTTPIDVTPAAQQFVTGSGTGQTTTLPSVTTVTDGAFIIGFDGAWDAPGAGNYSGTTPTLTARRTGSISKIFDATQTTAGATSARTRTNGNVSGILPWASIIVAIRPATSSNKSLAADSATFTWTGTAASLEHGREIATDAATYTWSGTAASLELGREIAADSATWTWTGTAATLLANRDIEAASGTFTWTGTAATLLANRDLETEAATFTWSGTAASLEHGFEIAADAAAFTWTATDATLIKTGDKVIAADSASWTWTGTAATLLANRDLETDSASFTWSGTDVSLELGREIAADSASFAWTGTDASLELNRELATDSASWTWVGTDATLTHAAVDNRDRRGDGVGGGGRRRKSYYENRRRYLAFEKEKQLQQEADEARAAAKKVEAKAVRAKAKLARVEKRALSTKQAETKLSAAIDAAETARIAAENAAAVVQASIDALEAYRREIEEDDEEVMGMFQAVLESHWHDFL